MVAWEGSPKDLLEIRIRRVVKYCTLPSFLLTLSIVVYAKHVWTTGFNLIVAPRDST